MDADCLIKRTKSNLKELVCRNFSVVVPQLVKGEVADNAFGHPDAQIITENRDMENGYYPTVLRLPYSPCKLYGYA